MINAVTLSPDLKTFLGFSTLPQLISEICKSPSAPPRSTNAPKSVTFFTVPSITSPGVIFSNKAFFCSSFLARRSCFLSPIILLLLGLNSVIMNSISASLYLDKSLSNVSDTSDAGINTLASSTTTLSPPSTTCTTLPVSTSLLLKASSSFLLPLS